MLFLLNLSIEQPDIGAPGVAILVATSPFDITNDGGFTIQTGTSIATPHISAIVALLKSLHPTWSPAAIKSAIITTGIPNFSLHFSFPQLHLHLDF